jgi:hypothetical protein
MVVMNLTPRERRLIQQWLETLRESAGHWGDGEVTFPDEAIVEHKLDEAGPARFTRFHLELIMEWAESTHHNLAFTVEELELLRRIREALQSPAPSRPLP